MPKMPAREDIVAFFNGLLSERSGSNDRGGCPVRTTVVSTQRRRQMSVGGTYPRGRQVRESLLTPNVRGRSYREGPARRWSCGTPPGRSRRRIVGLPSARHGLGSIAAMRPSGNQIPFSATNNGLIPGFGIRYTPAGRRGGSVSRQPGGASRRPRLRVGFLSLNHTRKQL